MTEMYCILKFISSSIERKKRLGPGPDIFLSRFGSASLLLWMDTTRVNSYEMIAAKLSVVSGQWKGAEGAQRILQEPTQSQAYYAL